MPTAPIDKLVIIGVGLIGGSFALALRKATQVRHIVGIGRSRGNMQRAQAVGAIDEIGISLPAALKDAALVLLATPVGQTEAVMAQISPYLEPDTIVTDAGSTKQNVVAAARRQLLPHLRNFVPGHPIAGAELSGAGAADAELFHGRNVVLTPLPETSAAAASRVAEWWEACGSRVFRMSAAEHDDILAMVSHLPHLLAFALMNHASMDRMHGAGSPLPSSLPPTNQQHYRPCEPLQFAGTGFRDMVRIAGSSPEMWRDICIANREALVRQIDAYQEELVALRQLLASGNGKELENAFFQARDARKRWLENQQ
jgi:prephenate dehydrogenase